MVSLKQVASAISYLVGTYLLIPGSVLSLAQYSDDTHTMGVNFYIAACTFLVVGALVDLIPFLKDRFSRKDGYSQLGEEGVATPPPKLFYDLSFWYVWMMFQGGVLFLTASCFYLFPNLVTAGTWVFRFGSFSYMTGTSISLRGVIKGANEKGGMNLDSWFWVAVCLQYLLGAVMYVLGGVLSQVGDPGSAVSWLIGSILFFTGSVTVVLQLAREYKK
mmetsp:Transcript_32356/g.44450  ORF Transcript_32356/g.44450 Transcript_32356/m.44450 type:complete len:218 (+) Transcript_32356:84-737(+)